MEGIRKLLPEEAGITHQKARIEVTVKVSVGLKNRYSTGVVKRKRLPMIGIQCLPITAYVRKIGIGR